MIDMRVTIARYQPLRGGSYIVLPKYISSKKACINVNNKDDNCLKWALRSTVFPARNNLNKTCSYPSEDGFYFDGISSPTPINQIKKLEKQNEMAINVFDYENKAIIVYQLSEQPASIARINLLLIYEEPKSHYVWIKDLNRLLYD